MRVHFWKMHGAGNDFILLDDRSGRLLAPDPLLIRWACSRRKGIGADGLILIGASEKHDFALRFFNPDGTEASMCGNGTRCAARLALELGAARPEMTIETRSGVLDAVVADDAVRLRMSPPSDWRSRQFLELDGLKLQYDFINTGVPHVVIETEDTANIDVEGLGAAVRRHVAFTPNGANVDFMSVRGPQELNVRTYEKGVEEETPACGTGAVACGLVAGRNGKISPPVKIVCASGDKLEVDYRLTNDGAENVSLLGPAHHVFQGVFEHQGSPISHE